MKRTLGHIKAPLNEIWQHLATPIKRQFNSSPLCGLRTVQHEIGNILGEPEASGVPNADPQSPEGWACQRTCNITHAVVPTVPAALFEPNGSGGKV
jgi:hypothetical protein